MKKFLQERKRIICILAPLGLGMVYLVLCMAGLQHAASTSEAYNAYLVRFDLSGIWELAATSTEPPLYLFVLKIWAHIFGHADFALRMMSAMIGALAILVAYLWMKYKYGATAAIVSVFLLAIAPFFVRVGQEIGAFTLAILIVIAASFALDLALNNRRKIWWAIYVLLIAAGLWTSYFCALTWLAHAIYLAKKYGKKIWRNKMLLAYLAALILWLPWLPSALRQESTVQPFEHADFSLVSVANAATETFVYAEATETKNIALVLCLIAAASTAFLLIRSRKKMSLLNSAWIAPMTGLILLAAGSTRINFDLWTVSFAGVIFMLSTGVGWTIFAREKNAQKKRRGKQKLPSRHALLATSSGVILCTTLICGLASVHAYKDYDLCLTQRHSADVLYENIVEFDFGQKLPIVVTSPSLYYELSTYGTAENPVTFIDENIGTGYGFVEPLHRSYFGKIANIEKFLAEHDAIWLVDYEPTDSAQLDFPYEGWRMTTRSDLHFSKDGEMYQILKLEKEQI